MSIRDRSCRPALPASIRRAAVVVLALAAVTAPVAAAPTRPGPGGFDPLDFAATNHGPLPMTCTVETAHFYTVDLGTAQVGETIARRFWVERRTGTVTLRNARLDAMPVQALWCGIRGRAWITRAAVTLDRRAGLRPSPLHLGCRSDAVLQCDARAPQAGGKAAVPQASP